MTLDLEVDEVEVKVLTSLASVTGITVVHLIGVYLMGVYFIGVHLMGVHVTGVYLMGVYLIGVYLIYESSLRAGHGWRESLYRHPGWFKSF